MRTVWANDIGLSFVSSKADLRALSLIVASSTTVNRVPHQLGWRLKIHAAIISSVQQIEDDGADDGGS